MQTSERDRYQANRDVFIEDQPVPDACLPIVDVPVHIVTGMPVTIGMGMRVAINMGTKNT